LVRVIALIRAPLKLGFRMHIVIYFITVPVLLLCGLLGLSAVLEPVDGIANIRLGMAAKSVPTTAAEMAARSRENALAVEAEFKRRNPPQPAVVSTVAVPADVKAGRTTLAVHHSAKRKSVRIARRDPSGAPAAGFAFAPAVVGFHSVND
jgi:hypothetical protein